MFPSSDPRIVFVTDCSNDNDVQRIEAAIAYVRSTRKALPIDVRIISDVEPYSILQGAFHLLEQARTWHWAAPVFVGVIDPGVGTERRAVALRTEAGYFVGPDNGVSTLLRQAFPVTEAVLLNPALRGVVPKPFAAPTFDGERLFAPAAALLALGTPLAEIGEKINPEGLIDLVIAPGTVLHCDKDFRNVKIIGLDRALAEAGDALNFSVNGTGRYTAKKGRTLHDGEGHAFVAYPGSSNCVEIASYKGFAADKLGVKVGDRIVVESAS